MADIYQCKISVRELIEFVLRSGDLDNRGKMTDTTAMKEGVRLHQKIQNAQPENYTPEVIMRQEFDKIHKGEGFRIIVDGRADGVIECASQDDKYGFDNTLLAMYESMVIIDEIKCMYNDVTKYLEPELLHLAQGKCYALFYLNDHPECKKIAVQVTYCNIETEKKEYFVSEYTQKELSDWFDEILEEYIKWMYWDKHHKTDRNLSIKGLKFPFEYREGQKDLVKNIYLTILRNKKIFIEAPTGVGKTMSAMFPSVMTLGEGLAQRIFYTTARTITRTVAEEAGNILKAHGLDALSITITAKDKICIIDKPDCNPLACPRAAGHEDRVNDAVYDLITHEKDISRETITKYADKHNVCPFEFALDVSLWCDIIICDYNYVFDPNVYLRRFFSNSNLKDNILLVDEAHNLVDRAREMYSAAISKDAVLEAKGEIEGREDIWKLINKVNRQFLKLKKEYFEPQVHVEYDVVKSLHSALDTLYKKLYAYMTSRKTHPSEELTDFYFDLRYFMTTMDYLDENYCITLNNNGKDFAVQLNCMNPADRLSEYLQFHRGTAFYSATLLPVKYYMDQLAGHEDDYAVYAPSPFDNSKRRIIIANDVSCKYTRRTDEEFAKYADYIDAFLKAKIGNYMVFFPSYKVMNDIYTALMTKYDGVISDMPYDIVMQESSMSEEAREKFLDAFAEEPVRGNCGFCVMGGIFSEGIDLKADRLIGVAIVGTGLPQVGDERELIKNYYDGSAGDGFEYAYLYPGMNKVLQAGGRVIRTAEDEGVILLLDERFLQSQYKNLLPREWSNTVVINRSKIEGELYDFWSSHGK